MFGNGFKPSRFNSIFDLVEDARNYPIVAIIIEDVASQDEEDDRIFEKVQSILEVVHSVLGDVGFILGESMDCLNFILKGYCVIVDR